MICSFFLEQGIARFSQAGEYMGQVLAESLPFVPGCAFLYINDEYLVSYKGGTMTVIQFPQLS